MESIQDRREANKLFQRRHEKQIPSSFKNTTLIIDSTPFIVVTKRGDEKSGENGMWCYRTKTMGTEKFQIKSFV
jgi:hypothetical protein